MSIIQKIIKYLSLAFAIFLIYIIFSSIFGGLSLVFDSFSFNSNNSKMSTVWISDNDYFDEIDVDIKYSDFSLIYGDEYLIKSEDTRGVEYSTKNGVLKIKDKKKFYFGDRKKIEIVIPRNSVFNDVNINNGAGEVYIEGINSQSINMDFGAGKVTIDSLTSDKVDIDSGAGKIVINSGSIGKLDFDMGVGEVVISSEIGNDTKIDAGVGNFIFNIFGNKDDYKITVDKGIGNVSVDNTLVNDNSKVGNGSKNIDVNGGIGNISINFK